MSKVRYDLESRCLVFSKRTLDFCKQLPKTKINEQLVKQLIRSSTSIGANYIEANDALGKKDFLHRLRISRKEAKETLYWLQLVDYQDEIIQAELNQEAKELRNILSAIINKVQSKNKDTTDK